MFLVKKRVSLLDSLGNLTSFLGLRSWIVLAVVFIFQLLVVTAGNAIYRPLTTQNVIDVGTSSLEYCSDAKFRMFSMSSVCSFDRILFVLGQSHMLVCGNTSLSCCYKAIL